MTTPEAPGVRRKIGWPLGAFLVGCAGSVVAVVLLAAGALPLGIRDQWQWLRRPEPLPVTPLFLGCLLTYVLAVFVGLRCLPRLSRDRLGAAFLLILIALGATAATVGFASLIPDDVVTVGLCSTNDISLGYASEAASFDSTREYLRQYHRQVRRPGPRPRVRTHPPGPTLYFRAVRALVYAAPGLGDLVAGLAEVSLRGPFWFLTETVREHTKSTLTRYDVAAALLGSYLMLLVIPLGAVAAFLLARELADLRSAVLAAALYALIPSLQLFFPNIDQMAALFTVTSLALLAVGLSRRRWYWLLPAGLALAGGVFWTYGFLAVLGAALLYCLVPIWPPLVNQERGPSPLARLVPAAWVLGGFLLCYGILWLTTGYNLPAGLAASLDVHEDIITTRWHRDYLPWLALNLYDLLLFLGPALLLPAMICVVRGVASPRVRWLVAIMAVIVALVDLSGSVRGEAGRIWAFLMPPFAVASAVLLARLEHRQRLLPVLVIAVQLAWTVALVRHLAPVQAIPLRFQPPAAHTSAQPRASCHLWAELQPRAPTDVVQGTFHWRRPRYRTLRPSVLNHSTVSRTLTLKQSRHGLIMGPHSFALCSRQPGV